MEKFNEMLKESDGLHNIYVETLSEEDKKSRLAKLVRAPKRQFNIFLTSASKWISVADSSEPHSTVPAECGIPFVSTDAVSFEKNVNVPDTDDVSDLVCQVVQFSCSFAQRQSTLH